MSLRRWAGLGVLLAVAGCSQPAPYAPPKEEGEAKFNAALLEPMLLAEKPEGALTVRHVKKTAKDGDLVVMSGQVPPEGGTLKVLFDTKAVVKLASEEDINEHKGDIGC